MTILYGDVTVICPKTNEEVTVRKKCANIDGKGNCCPYFDRLFYGGGWKIGVKCNYGSS